MKRYKLTRDFGTFKAGQEFEDNLRYIMSLQEIKSKYPICLIKESK